MFEGNKGISPVIATALLLVVTVVSVVSFQSWFTNFSSSMFSDVEIRSISSEDLKIDNLIGDTLYVYSSDETNLKKLKLEDKETGKVLCEFSQGDSSVSNEGLVLYLPFDEVNLTTNTTPDSSGKNNDGTLKTEGSTLPQLVSNNCHNDNCLEFNGVDSYIEMIDKRDFDFSDDDNFTIIFWSNKKTNIVQPLFSKYISYNLVTSYLNHYNFKAKFPVTISHNSINFVNISNLENIAYVWDGTSHNGSFYINGQFDSSKQNTSNLWYANTENLRIGTNWDFNNFLNATLDDVKIFNRTLSSNEILANYLGISKINLKLNKGMNQINISNCNLKKDKLIDITAYTNKNIIEKYEVIK